MTEPDIALQVLSRTIKDFEFRNHWRLTAQSHPQLPLPHPSLPPAVRKQPKMLYTRLVRPEKGTPMRRDNFWRKCMHPKLKPVGLGWATFQVMRRTFATLSKAAGVDAHTRSAQMGNTRKNRRWYRSIQRTGRGESDHRDRQITRRCCPECVDAECPSCGTSGLSRFRRLATSG